MGYTFQFRDVWRNFDFFVEGVRFTAFLTVIAMAAAIVLGTATAMAKGGRTRLFSRAATLYVEVVRNTPLLVQLWFVYFGLGEIGINMSALSSGLFTLAINTGAYTAEILRAGFDSVDREIKEAAASLGMTPWQTYKAVIFPLGFRAVLPALCNMSIQCLLASALLSVLGINELTNQATRLASKTFRAFEWFAAAGAMYILIAFIITMIFRLVEKRMSKGSLH